MSPATPTIQALVIADMVFRDPATGKFLIAGTFNTISSGGPFPKQYGRPFFAYLSLTGIHGQADLSFRFVDLEDYSVVVQSPSGLRVEAPNPLEVAEAGLQFPNLPLPKPGTYALEVHMASEHGDALLASHRIQIKEKSQ